MANETKLTDAQIRKIAHMHYLADLAEAGVRITTDQPVGYETGACTVAEDACEIGVSGEIDERDAYDRIARAYRELRDEDREGNLTPMED